MTPQNSPFWLRMISIHYHNTPAYLSTDLGAVRASSSSFRPSSNGSVSRTSVSKLPFFFSPCTGDKSKYRAQRSGCSKRKDGWAELLACSKSGATSIVSVYIKNWLQPTALWSLAASLHHHPLSTSAAFWMQEWNDRVVCKGRWGLPWYGSAGCLIFRDVT